MNSFEHKILYNKILEKNIDSAMELKSEEEEYNHKFYNRKFYNRMGEEIERWKWVLLHDSQEYALIRHDSFENFSICTFWCGVSENECIGIYKTFYRYDEKFYSIESYVDEFSAIRGHNKLVFCADQKMIPILVNLDSKI